jgi:hypothetical protein
VAKVGIIYATNSKMVRRVIHPDRDDELGNPNIVKEGESLLIVEREHYKATGRDACIHAHTGVHPPEPRAAIVHPSGDIVGIIAADPDIDSVDWHPGHAGHTLVHCPDHEVTPGTHRWHHGDKQFKYKPGHEPGSPAA